MTANRRTAQHRVQIAKLRRSIAIETPIIAACAVAAVCSWVLSWHPVLRALLSFVSFMQLMHLPGLFTRWSEQRARLAAAEAEQDRADAPG